MIDTSLYTAFLFDMRGTIVRQQEENEVITTPGLKEFLDLLKEEEKKLAVVTSSSREQLEFLLKFLDLDAYFDVTVARDDVKETKPSPEPYLKALELLGVGAEEAIAFEDSVTGITSAKDAGIFVVGVGEESIDPAILEVADMHVKNFLKILEEINSNNQGPVFGY